MPEKFQECDNKMNDQTANRRLEEDRRHLLFRLDRIGYVPDDDMRAALESIKADLRQRIDAVTDKIKLS